MNEPHQDLFDYFPMQAALGLYSLHKHPYDDDEDENTPIVYSQPSRKEEQDECT